MLKHKKTIVIFLASVMLAALLYPRIMAVRAEAPAVSNLANAPAAAPEVQIGGIDLGNLTDYLFFFADARSDANWQGATKGFVGDVAIDGIQADERTSGGVPYAGTIYTNDSTLSAWQGIVDQNAGQAFGSTGQTALINGLTADLVSAIQQINALPATAGYTSRTAASLDGTNTQNSVCERIVVNVTSEGAIATITGDACDVFVLRWDTDADPSNGYQGQAKLQSGDAIIPAGGLKPTNFINVAGEIGSSGGGGNPPAPYPQGPRLNDGTGALCTGCDDFSGGGFFTGYWLTTGKPDNFDPGTGLYYGTQTSLSNGIFVGGWYSLNTQFSMTSGTSGVYVSPPVSQPTPTPTDTPTDTPTATPTDTPTATPTDTPTATPTDTPTATPTDTPTATPTNTPTATPPPSYGAIGDFVWYDSNSNGIQNIDEPGLANVVIDLYKDTDSSGDLTPSDTLVDSTVTDADGGFLFPALAPGAYIVDVRDAPNPDGQLPTGIGFLDHTLGRQSLSDPTSAIVLSADEVYKDADFGYVQSADVNDVIIGDTVWYDDNGDGVQQPGEPGIPDVEVCATAADPAILPICILTDSNGHYLFVIAPGTYSITIPTPPANLSPTTAAVIGPVILPAGTVYLKADFGFNDDPGNPQLGTIGNLVFLDANQNGALGLGDSALGGVSVGSDSR